MEVPVLFLVHQDTDHFPSMS